MPRKRKYWNPRAQQRINPKTGKFMKKVGVKPLTPALPASADLMTCLASLRTPMAIAKRIDRLSGAGDGAATALFIKAHDRHTAALALGDQRYDTTKLSEPWLRLLLSVLQMARGEHVPDAELIANLRACLKELNPMSAADALPDNDPDDEDEPDLTPPTLPMPEPSPLPTRRAIPKHQVLGYDQDTLSRAQPSTGGRPPPAA